MSGRVCLVGAGPGDPGLLTARALELIAQADVILHDRLIPLEALAGAREDAEIVFVGKQGDASSVPQEQTEALMLARARAGAMVVRLKGGDPFVFGRGGEEALALRAAGIDYEVVPGVTAGVAALAYAGIPVTHRDAASAVALVTGRTRTDEELDWPALAAFPGTLVFYMGAHRLEQIARSLIVAGRPPGQPAAIVENGTLPAQRSVIATLGTIAAEAKRQRLGAPAVIVVGEVAGLGERLAWLAAGPLTGITIAVTRARAQASGLARQLRRLGAAVVQAPVVRTRVLPGPPLDPSGYDLVCVTSANGAEALFERLAAGGRDARALAGARVAAIGQGTSAALARHGIMADITPERSLAEGLVEALADVPMKRALIARAREGRAVLPDALRRRGVAVEVLPLYETVPEPLSAAELAQAWAADYITFTSSSTVRHFMAAAGAAGAGTAGAGAAGAGTAGAGTAGAGTAGAGTAAAGTAAAGGAGPAAAGAAGAIDGVGAGTASRARIVSIGPVTSATLREHGLAADVEAARHDVDGIVQALLDDAAALADAPAAAAEIGDGSTAAGPRNRSGSGLWAPRS